MSNITSRIYKPADFSVGQVHEMLVTLGKKGFSPEMATQVANTKSGKAEEIVGLFPTLAVSGPVAFFQRFYQDFCGLEVDFSSARVPEPQGDFTLLLGIPQGLTPNRMFEACSQRFPCWSFWDDLDAATQGRNEREPIQSYFIMVRDRREADEELKNLSADDIKEQALKTETLLERLVHEAVFFVRTGEHLDVDNVALCAGSRDQDGVVPGANWYGGEFGVGLCNPGSSLSRLRAREVVS